MSERDSDRKRISTALDRMAEHTPTSWRGDYACCQTCLHYELSEEGVSRYVAWHRQSDEGAFGIERELDVADDDFESLAEFDVEKTDTLHDWLFLYFDVLVAAEDAALFLREAGFVVEWDGTASSAVAVRTR